MGGRRWDNRQESQRSTEPLMRLVVQDGIDAKPGMYAGRHEDDVYI